MNHYLIFGIGVFLGVAAGFILATFCDAAHDGDHPQELWQAYQDGFDAGQGKPGLWWRSPLSEPDDSYGCCGVKPVTAVDLTHSGTDLRVANQNALWGQGKVG